MPDNKEVRFIAPAELRFEAVEGQNPKVVGYASVYNVLSGEIKPGLREVIRPGAFTRVLAANPDVRFLLNHKDLPLARSTSGTLKLSEDEKGLRFEADLDPSDPDVQRILPKMRRGDLNNCSFAFNVARDGESFSRSEGYDVREVSEVGGLYDVSLVTYPAYESADADLRSYQKWKVDQEKQATPEGVDARTLLIHLDLMQL